MYHDNSTELMFSSANKFYPWSLHLGDSRTKGWLFVDSPVPTLTLTCAYLVVVWIGPKLMINRKPFEVRPFLIAYNLALAMLNFYLAFEFLLNSLLLNYSYLCQPCQVYPKDEIRISSAIWWFYISKCIEFCDSFFFILRKKDKQLSFLHVYHHSTMFPMWWIVVKYVPCGSTFMPAMLNSFIHIFVYTYYGLSSIGPHIAKYLWWKRYITIIQLVQFVIGLCLGVYAIWVNCAFPLWIKNTLVIYVSSMFILFGNYYINEYTNKCRRKFRKTEYDQLI